MPIKTPLDRTRHYVAHHNRQFPKDLLDKMRVLAALRRTTMQHIETMALEIGLPVLERQTNTK
jgi:hypothetical protein